MLVKLTMVGPVTVARNGKNVRDIMAEGWPEKKSAWDKTADAFNNFTAGQQVEVELDKTGKYINSVRNPGEAAPTGGSGYGKKSSGFTPDPEKNAAVYTSYALDLMKADAKLTPADAVDKVFATRALVKGKL